MLKKLLPALVCVFAGLILVPEVAVATTAAGVAEGTYESQVLTYTNKYRGSHDLKSLVVRSCVDSYAEKQARKMRDAHKLYHQSMTTIMSACNLRMVGENIAYGYTSGHLVVNAWMNSPGHRANILKSGYRLLGVGAVKDSHGIWWVSQVFGTAR